MSSVQQLVAVGPGSFMADRMAIPEERAASTPSPSSPGMNVNLLIDAIVRQTATLIAQLATAAGGRPSLAHTGNQLFVDLVRELKERGVGNKVIADMFGLALRTYHDKMRRLEESSGYGGRSLWEAVLAHIQERESVLQADVFLRFRNDNNLTLRGVLSDLVDSGLVFRTGRGMRTTLRAATAAEVELKQKDERGDGIANLVWVVINRTGYVSLEQIRDRVPIDEVSLESALRLLIADGRVRRAGTREQPRFTTDECVIPEGSVFGWEAAVFDHFQAMVGALRAKIGSGQRAGSRDSAGGSTFSFTVWESHPMKDEVVGLLAQSREQMAQLRLRVADYNSSHPPGGEELIRVSAYVGQSVVSAESQ
jgi:hypothetical protein